MKLSLSILWLSNRCRISAQRCSHGRLRGGYNVYETRSRLIIAGLSFAAVIGVFSANAQVNVTQHHNHDSRDGLYVDPAFTQNAAGSLTRDLGFDGTISGNVYAQPLYIEGGPNGPMVIAVTESNNVYALDPVDGSIIWQRNDFGAPVARVNLPCGNIDPVGITGTPVVDLASRSLFFNAMTTPMAARPRNI
jgi:hypothetical protein